jgi:hypothetical protein
MCEAAGCTAGAGAVRWATANWAAVEATDVVAFAGEAPAAFASATRYFGPAAWHEHMMIAAAAIKP